MPGPTMHGLRLGPEARRVVPGQDHAAEVVPRPRTILRSAPQPTRHLVLLPRYPPLHAAKPGSHECTRPCGVRGRTRALQIPARAVLHNDLVVLQEEHLPHERDVGHGARPGACVPRKVAGGEGEHVGMKVRWRQGAVERPGIVVLAAAAEPHAMRPQRRRRADLAMRRLERHPRLQKARVGGQPVAEEAPDPLKEILPAICQVPAVQQVGPRL
mmetsp:Transcript_1082/g.3164  ORF Transcript_1082/g.3164 Transcript_1082/m.3164 type:complete len:214 (+) Transcript_1082:156-797(+)